ncbi:CubicO group peptidase, beta-lactamase class C family [Thermoflexibacter ruber]|uniref:CubicO group peptidase, beta-lactamase class C family n=2 Tax=Thermoflexibacter ruber TaxID=1003 RepID=A0A1I2EXZ4_9BACT|nr:CubicO group peptidase, beta-lactamase class C family [Thermoflexibacter ruber]
MRYNRLVQLFLVLFILLSEIAYSQTLKNTAPEEAGLSSQRLARLENAMSDWVKNNWINGALVLIARNGKIAFHKAEGYNDLETKAPLDKNGIFRIASQTKAITTVAAMMLWEEGKFSLEDSVAKFIPTFSNQKVIATYNPADTSYTTVPAKRPITIRDLLTHTSGLGYAGIGTPMENAIYAKNWISGGLGVNNQKIGEVMSNLGKLPLFFQPGEKWKYSLGTDVLGYLIEIWSGMTLEEFFNKRIFEPLGMKDTYFNIPPDKASRLVNFFQADQKGVIKKQAKTFGGTLDMNYPLNKTTYFSGGGGLSSTIYDYAIFLQMLLNNGQYNGVRLLARNTVRMMTMNQIGDLFIDSATRPENKFGFGFSLITESGSRLAPNQAGTYSWGGAFSTTYWVDPKENMVVILYRQIWSPGVAEVDKVFKTLVYQAIND